MKVDILGQEYEIHMGVSELDDKELEECDGYIDRTTKKIVIARKPTICTLEDFSVYQKSVIRHEIIHAFMYESGLDGNSVWTPQKGESHPEQVVEWIAMQFPKMMKAFKEADAL